MVRMDALALPFGPETTARLPRSANPTLAITVEAANSGMAVPRVLVPEVTSVICANGPSMTTSSTTAVSDHATTAVRARLTDVVCATPPDGLANGAMSQLSAKARTATVVSVLLLQMRLSASALDTSLETSASMMLSSAWLTAGRTLA